MPESNGQLTKVLAACREAGSRWTSLTCFQLIAQPSISAQNIGILRVRRSVRANVLDGAGFSARLDGDPGAPTRLRRVGRCAWPADRAHLRPL